MPAGRAALPAARPVRDGGGLAGRRPRTSVPPPRRTACRWSERQRVRPPFLSSSACHLVHAAGEHLAGLAGGHGLHRLRLGRRLVDLLDGRAEVDAAGLLDHIDDGADDEHDDQGDDDEVVVVPRGVRRPRPHQVDDHEDAVHEGEDVDRPAPLAQVEVGPVLRPAPAPRDEAAEHHHLVGDVGTGRGPGGDTGDGDERVAAAEVHVQQHDDRRHGDEDRRRQRGLGARMHVAEELRGGDHLVAAEGEQQPRRRRLDRQAADEDGDAHGDQEGVRDPGREVRVEDVRDRPRPLRLRLGDVRDGEDHRHQPEGADDRGDADREQHGARHLAGRVDRLFRESPGRVEAVHAPRRR